ncbi:MAG: aldehyde dehydrogenase [Rhizobiaceae bacterium]|nr:aldehyde dehydrogenase [Rhizobiaceae bacterium]
MQVPNQHRQHFIGGAWRDPVAGRYRPAKSPGTGDTIGEVAEGERQDAALAIEAAKSGHEALSQMTRWQRADLCHRVADSIETQKDYLAYILALEQGKPLKSEAYGEIEAAATGFREAAELFKFMNGDFIPAETPGKRVISFRVPRGIYAVVTPWNFPINIPVEYLAPCLAAGNAVVWAPAPTTSLCASALMQCIADAGVPDGAVNLVHGPGAVVGDELVVNPDTHGIGFTGSPVTGAKIAQRGAGKPMLLELGGNGPVIVLDDADIERAARAAADGAFINAGQVCAATGRVLCTRTTYDELAQRITAAAQELVLGDPLQPATTVGPLNNHAVIEKVEAHVADGLARGGTLLAGGCRKPELGSDLYYAPTVMADLGEDADLNRAETFGPVAPIIVCRDEEEILRVANAAGHGLAAGVFSRDLAKAFRFAERVGAGLVNINGPSHYWELHIPFGGAPGKQSGLGRLGGRHTLHAVTEIKTISYDLG